MIPVLSLWDDADDDKPVRVFLFPEVYDMVI
jgi:hypothetical protein